MTEHCQACGYPLDDAREIEPDATVCQNCAMLQPWTWWEEERHAIVGCGAKKADERLPAADLYTSDYFGQKRGYAELACDNWQILSAKWALVGPDCPLDPYDVTMSDHDEEKREEWTKFVATGLRSTVSGMTPQSELVVLAGQDYLEPVRDVLDALPVQVIEPFEGTAGIGEQRSWLSSQIDRHAPTDQQSITQFA